MSYEIEKYVRKTDTKESSNGKSSRKEVYMSERDCPLCKQRGKTWEGDNPKCAFARFRFSFDNWNCATMNKLREIAEQIGLKWRADLTCGSFGAVPFEGEEYQGYIVMTWYKERGTVSNAILVCDDEPTMELNLTIALEAIEYWESRKEFLEQLEKERL